MAKRERSQIGSRRSVGVRWWSVPLALAAAAALAGCSWIGFMHGRPPVPPELGSPNPVAASPGPIGSAPAGLVGTWAVKLLTSDVLHTDEAGSWYLTLDDSLHYEFGRLPSDPHPNAGDLQVEGDTITFLHESGPGACGGAGAYHFTVNGDQLTFQVVQDFCGVRVKQTTARPYVRCPGGPAECKDRAG